MKNSTKKFTLNFIGILLLAFGIVAIFNTILNAELGLAPILWMSYLCLILLGIGILKKDSYLIASQVNILLIPYIFWNIDFYYYLINRKSLFSIVNYVFAPGHFLGKIITSQHLFNIPLSLYCIYLIKMKRKDFWKASFVQVILVYFATITLTLPEKNVNCVFRNCANFDFGIYYPVEWFLFYFLMILFTNYLITRFKIFIS